MNNKDKFKEYLNSNHFSAGTISNYTSFLSGKIKTALKEILGKDIDLWNIDDPQLIINYMNHLRESSKWEPMNKSDNNGTSASLKKYIEFLKSRNDTVVNNHAHKLFDEPDVVMEAENKTMESFANTLCSAVKETGLIYSDYLIKRYIAALLTKPFVILSGLAGSGKTQLALVCAHALCKDVDEQLCFVAVGADWTNREPLLGYPNGLRAGEYVKPENGVLDILIRANKNPDKPYFLILDEMNLSYVERYFADFLSAMESHKPIALWSESGKNIPHCVNLPSNIFIIGTINVDETTYMFSPKVLDRASVIEFKIDEAEMSYFLSFSSLVDINKANGKVADFADYFIKVCQSKEFEKDEKLKNILLLIFQELKKVNAEFGYRTATEICKYILQASNLGLTQSEAIDSAIVQKLLPKLHGSKKQVGPVLAKLWDICLVAHDGEPLRESSEFNESDFIYPLTANKVLRMFKTACYNGFTSFAEA